MASKLLIETLLEENLISERARFEMLNLLEKLDEDKRDNLVAILREYPEWIAKLHQNLQDKRAALAANDPAAWEKIIKEEEEELKKMENSR